jgi:hypothetical protein
LPPGVPHDADTHSRARRMNDCSLLRSRPREVTCAPAPQRVENGSQGATVRGQAVQNTRMCRPERAAGHEIVGLHLTELLTKNFGGDARHRTAELSESVRTIEEPLKEHWLPPSLDDADGCVEWTRSALAATVSPHCD